MTYNVSLERQYYSDEDQRIELEQEARERGFESVEDMQEYDRERYLERDDYYRSVV